MLHFTECIVLCPSALPHDHVYQYYLFLKKLKIYSAQEIRFQHFKKNMVVLDLLRSDTAYPKLCMLNFLMNVKYFLRKCLIICSFALDIYSPNPSLKS